MAWDDEQYLRFAAERTRPARELLARVPLEAAEHAIDLGCGPGNSTALLVAHYPGARVVGVDNDPTMLRRARSDLPSVPFVEADLTSYRPDQPADLLFANAALQWTPDHAQLFPELLARLRSGGALAVQMPNNFDEPSHVLMRSLPGPWLATLENVRGRGRVAAAEDYYDWLAPHSATIDIWQTQYAHVLDDAEAIVQWLEGTGLRPYLAALPESQRKDYRRAYRDAIESAYPARADGRRLFHFPRLFMVAVRR